MTVKYLEYSLTNGFIHNWIITGPELTVLDEFPGKPFELETQKERIFQKVPKPGLKFNQTPIERDQYKIDKTEFMWKYYRCSDDHLVHSTTVLPTWGLLTTWAYTKIIAPESPVSVEFKVIARGPVSIWLNDERVFFQDKFFENWQHFSVPITLQPHNDLFVRMDQVSTGESALQFGLEISGFSSSEAEQNIKIQIPTKARFPHRYQHFENILENAYLEDVVHYRGDHFNLRWMEDIKDESYVGFEVQDAQERFYVQGKWQVDPKTPQDVGHTYRLYERPYWVALMATEKEYFDQGLRYSVRLPIHILDNAYQSMPSGSPFERRQEALKDAAKHETDLFAMIARMETDRWSDIMPNTILGAVNQVNLRNTDCEVLLLGLIMLVYRYMGYEQFPQDLKEPVVNCILNYPFQANTTSSFSEETSAILRHASEILAGQHFSEMTFTATGQTGKWHADHGQDLTEAWLSQRAQTGFSGWNSNSEWPVIFMVLAQLVSLSDSEEINERAAVLLDKMLFLLAVNSFKGVFASSHGITSAGMLKSAQLEATSGVMRMLWGVGVFNQHILGTVGLACSDYEYPSFYYELANSLPNETLTLERQSVLSDREVNLVTYKTPDYLLSSAQDYYPGTSGKAEHLWQATFGPEAVVFVNHPSCSSEDPAYQPGFWLGNVRLPRIAQWKDVLISVYNLPEDDWMGFTHAYFPLPAFDDFFFDTKWAFLRKGSGYLALSAAQETQFIRQGPNAYRELRSTGKQNTWVCLLGREELDGSFEKFRNQITNLALEWQPLGVSFKSQRGEDVSFSWQGPLLVNDQPQPLSGFPNIQNQYCTTPFPPESMEIKYDDYLMKLKFK